MPRGRPPRVAASRSRDDARRSARATERAPTSELL